MIVNDTVDWNEILPSSMIREPERGLWTLDGETETDPDQHLLELMWPMSPIFREIS